VRLLESLVTDLRFATRAAAKKPGFTAIAVATLAVGVGATSALFSAVDAVLLRPLPFADASRLVAVGTTPPSGEYRISNASYPDFVDYRDQTSSFAVLVAYRSKGATLQTPVGAERISGARVSGGFFEALGITMAYGRSFSRDEDRMGGPRVAVLGHELWARRFSSDPGLVGRSIDLDGESYTVSGIAPPGFSFPHEIGKAQIFTPISLDDKEALEERDMRYLDIVGRLRRGVPLEQARADLKMVGERLEKQFPDSNTKRWGYAAPLEEKVVGAASRRGLWILMGAVVCVLLVACANVANLMLARATEREREVAIRGALGADRKRLARQLLTESIFLGLAGGVAGLLVAWAGTQALIALAPADMPRISEIRLDYRVVLFTFIVSALTGVLFGSAPSLRGSQVDLGKALTESGRGVGATGGPRRQRLRNALIVAEVALSLVLLAGAGLLLRSLDKVQRVHPGFDPSRVITAQISLSELRYGKPHQALAFHQRLVERLGSIPGVASVATANPLPFTDSVWITVIRDAGRPEPAPADRIDGWYRAVSPGYFETMKQPITRGRAFADSELRGGHPVVMLSEALATKLFDDRDPVGQKVKLGVVIDDWDEKAEWEVIGIVADTAAIELDKPAPMTFYVSVYQQPWTGFNVVVRSTLDPTTLGGLMQKEVRALDPEVPFYDMRTLPELMNKSMAERRFQTLLLGAFSATGLFLAAIGLYGVMSYSVNLRAREIGIRMALGAERQRVLNDVLCHGLVLTSIGVVIGLGASLGLARALESVLFRISATDPPALGGASVVLVLVALAASYLPARRATGLDPMVTLRSE
jgi:putative ABC transport system permease protein